MKEPLPSKVKWSHLAAILVMKLGRKSVMSKKNRPFFQGSSCTAREECVGASFLVAGIFNLPMEPPQNHPMTPLTA